MKLKISIMLFAILFTSSIFPGEYLTVQANDNVNNSVFDLYDKQENPSTNHSNENKVPNSDVENSNPNEGERTIGVTAWDMIKTIFVLIFVIGLLIALLKWLQRKGNLSPALQTMKNLGGTSLGGNRSVQMIKTGNSILIVGVGEDVQLLKEIKDEKEIEEILKVHNNQIEQLLQPKDLISKMISKWNGQKESENKSSLFKNELTKQLDDLKEERKKVLEEHIKKGSKDKNE